MTFAGSQGPGQIGKSTRHGDGKQADDEENHVEGSQEPERRPGVLDGGDGGVLGNGHGNSLGRVRDDPAWRDRGGGG